LCSKKRDLLAEIVEIYGKREREGFAAGSLSLRECYDLIASLSSEHSETRIMIDALDETEPAAHEEIIKGLESITRSSKRATKTMISSRDSGKIPHKLRDVPNIYIEATDNKEDIDRFISRQVDSAIQTGELLYGELDETLKSTIIEKLQEKANGMFVSLIFP
jgi:hypothetical protein